ncbi:folate-binding protein YgfZ [Tianweitania sp. BSSL-BM11]|uniref:Folate-binding protein YgfZ n=1 Tax=Tianweitania aestuarii TaxID=2814886 RepID=A0ABS5RSC4_9HYPH|nr:folate-binding protein YgfZ [Tianweitania aestuarii]MBS9719950.1 folate-binding protein YgfZ [Tianweitania aestuarii]
MPLITLPDRTCILVTGPEAEDFLQNILTLDLQTVGTDDARPGALLTPQGKILFDFLISRVDGGFCLECRSDIAADFARRLMMYRLRARAEIALQDECVVQVSWNEESASSPEDSAVLDRRFPEGTVHRVYDADRTTSATREDWTAYRVAHGVAESGSDYELSDAFPHDVLLDQNGGVGFKKGCYVGQEVVSRMQHRGTARRRVLIADSEASLPASGTPITADGRPIGTMGSSSGGRGLALVRIDKVKNAVDRDVPVLAGETSITLSIPAWARFDFPQSPSSED